MTRWTRVLVVGIAVGSFIVSLGFVIELIRSRFVLGPTGANYVTLPFGALVSALIIGTTIAVRRPRATTGWLLALAAATTGISYYRFSTHPWLAAGGLVVFFASALLPLHAAVAAGEGVSRATSRVLVGAQTILLALGVVILLSAPPGAIDRWFVGADARRHVVNMFQQWDARGVAHGAYIAWWVTLLTTATFAVAVRFASWRRAPRRVRRTEGPVILGALTWLVLLAGSAAMELIERTPAAREAVSNLAAVALPAMALALLGGVIGWVELLEPRLTRRDGAIEVGALMRDRSGLRALLCELLATRRVDVAYAITGAAPNEHAWIDADGRALDLEHDRRARTIVTIGGEITAAILHERDVPVDAVQLGARLTAAQLAAERATALSRARAEAVRTAAAELVRAGDRAAQAVSAEMHAGPIPELVTVADQLRTDPAALATASEELRAITTDLRTISHGLLPRVLEDLGLEAALGNRAAVDRRLPHAIEVTAYLLAVDDPDAHIRDDGATITVTRAQPPTAETVSRTAALGGTIAGTVVTLPAG